MISSMHNVQKVNIVQVCHIAFFNVKNEKFGILKTVWHKKSVFASNSESNDMISHKYLTS